MKKIAVPFSVLKQMGMKSNQDPASFLAGYAAGAGMPGYVKKSGIYKITPKGKSTGPTKRGFMVVWRAKEGHMGGNFPDHYLRIGKRGVRYKQDRADLFTETEAHELALAHPALKPKGRYYKAIVLKQGDKVGMAVRKIRETKANLAGEEAYVVAWTRPAGQPRCFDSAMHQINIPLRIYLSGITKDKLTITKEVTDARQFTEREAMRLRNERITGYDPPLVLSAKVEIERQEELDELYEPGFAVLKRLKQKGKCKRV